MPLPPHHTVATLNEHVGHDFGAARAIRVDQLRIDEFAECTGDDQWIHVDAERARAETPFGNTIAHGLLLLSLIPPAQFELRVYPADASNVLNYGYDKVRFLAPVVSGSKVAIRVELTGVEDKGPGRTLVRCRNTATVEGRPDQVVMVADSLAMVMS